MNKKEIIEMAQRCGLFGIRPYPDSTYFEALEAFAKLIAEKEREKFCAVLRQLHDSYSLTSDSNAIRARGQE